MRIVYQDYHIIIAAALRNVNCEGIGKLKVSQISIGETEFFVITKIYVHRLVRANIQNVSRFSVKNAFIVIIGALNNFCPYAELFFTVYNLFSSIGNERILNNFVNFCRTVDTVLFTWSYYNSTVCAVLFNRMKICTYSKIRIFSLSEQNEYIISFSSPVTTRCSEIAIGNLF